MAEVWYRWPVGEHEIHVVPEVERHRHRPVECWCDPSWDLMRDGTVRVTHRMQWINNGLQRINGG